MKKKILIIITIFMLMLSINYEVKADGEAPSSRDYKVVVKNKKGTPLYDQDGKVVTTIPYKGVASVIYEGSDDNNKKILYVTYKEYDGYWSYYIKAEDIIPKDYNLSDAVKLDEKREAMIFNKNGGVLYEGPSDVYNKVSKVIPTGTSVTYQYVSSGDWLWAYVEYDGANGWLWIYSGGRDSDLELGYVVDKVNSDIELLSIKKTAKLYSSIYAEDNEVVDTIDINSKLSCKYYYNNKCYLEYEGQSGWVKFDDNFVYRATDKNDEYSNTKILVIYDTYLYKDTNFKNKYDIKIPSDVFLDDFYYQHYYGEEGFYADYYVKYKNQYGWVQEGVVTDYYDYEEVDIYDIELNIYKKPDTTSEVTATIPKNTEIRSQCDTWIDKDDSSYCWTYIDYNGVTGWVNIDEQYNNNDAEDDETNNENESGSNDKFEENNTNWFKSLTPIQFSLLCIGAAIVLAVTSIVIILLIKKNNKKAKDSKKDADKTKVKEPVKKTKEKEKATSNETTKLEKKEIANKEEMTDKK